MMISKDQSIVTQVAAKIAAELIIKTEDTTKNVAEWLTAFDAVSEALMKAHATDMVKSAFPGATEVTAPNTYSKPASQFTVTTAPVTGDLAVAGKQHGDLPKWLLSACAKAGVGRVWDNRDTAIGTKRPWFKQADAPEGVEPAAFWPPKGNA
jgi:hypothetical protein